MSSLERERSGERRVVQAMPLGAQPLGAQRGPHSDGKKSPGRGKGLEARRSPNTPQFQLDSCVWSTLILFFVSFTPS